MPIWWVIGQCIKKAISREKELKQTIKEQEGFGCLALPALFPVELPKIPIASFENIKSKGNIGDGMGHNTSY